DRVVESEALRKSLKLGVGGLVGHEAEDDHVLVLVLACDLGKIGNLRLAGPTPGRPEVDDDHLADQRIASPDDALVIHEIDGGQTSGPILKTIRHRLVGTDLDLDPVLAHADARELHHYEDHHTDSGGGCDSDIGLVHD